MEISLKLRELSVCCDICIPEIQTQRYLSTNKDISVRYIVLFTSVSRLNPE